MIILLNGNNHRLDEHTTVGTLVDTIGSGRAGIAVARNREVIPRSLWDTEVLQETDQIEILVAAQGG